MTAGLSHGPGKGQRTSHFSSERSASLHPDDVESVPGSSNAHPACYLGSMNQIATQAAFSLAPTPPLLHDFRNVTSGHPAMWGGGLLGPLKWDSAPVKATLDINIACIDLSPDQTTLAVATGSSLYLYNSSTLERRATLGEGLDEVLSVNFSPDGTALLSEEDGSPGTSAVKLWSGVSTADGPWQMALPVPLVNVSLGSFGSYPFSKDGSVIYYIEGNFAGPPVVVVLDVATKETRLRLEGHTDAIMWVGESPDRKLIATSSWDQTVRLWSAVDGTLLHILRGSPAQSWAAAFSPDSQTIAAGSGSGVVWLWDTATGEVIHKLEGHGWVRSLAFTTDGKSLAVGADVGKLRVFDVGTGTSRQHWKIAQDASGWWTEVSEVQYSVIGNRLLFKTSEGLVTVYDEATNEKWVIEPEPSRMESGFWFQTSRLGKVGRAVWSVGKDKTVRRWDL